MVTRDGVRLDADVYYPDNWREGGGEYPVLLMRQPYGRAIASTVVYAHPVWYANQGYIVVIQDVRGRGTSQGEFQLFQSEIEDGFDTVNWAAKLPGSNGKVGMYGFSYQGMTQLYAAAEYPKALKVICPAMVGYDLYSDWAYEGGAFCLQANLGWAIQLAAETARLKGDEKAYQALFKASRNLPLFDPIPAYPEVLKEFAPDSFYHDWISHPQNDDYWQTLSPKCFMAGVDLPTLHIGGWFDTFLRGTLNLYQAMSDRCSSSQSLIVGPWAHLPWGRKVGSKDYGTEANSPIDELQIRWFDQFLKDKDTGILEEPPVYLFEMGSNQWKFFDSWNQNPSTTYFLASNGLASMRDDAGSLQLEITESTTDILVHDPWRPVPSLGGHASIPSGSLERSSLDCRSDILTYTSEILPEDLHLVGDIFVEIYCNSEQPSFDLCAIVSEVFPNGNVYNFSQGYCRVLPEEKSKFYKIQLQATCMKISRGNRLRLSLSGACFPAYPVNSGTGKLDLEARNLESKVITLLVQSGLDFPSNLQLPQS